VWRGVIDGNKPLLLYQFTPDRSGEHAANFLAGWRGYLQADAYSGYDRNFVGGQIIEVGCMAHARRRYFDIAKNAKTPGFAHDIVQRIAELYAIERKAKESNLAPHEHQRLRQERAPPQLAALKERLEAHLPKVPPKGPLAEAIGYTLNHWTALTRYLDDGRLEIDNNAVERAIRPVARPHSLCTSSSSVWKHWSLIFRNRPTRATLSRERGNDSFVLQVVGTDLVGCAGNNLLGRQNTFLDEPADLVIGDSELSRGLRHREPLPIFLRRTIRVDAMHGAQRSDTARVPSFSLTRRYRHAVQRGRDVRVGPPACHATHHGQGFLGSATAMLA
jgi:hypothetical protein